MSDPAEIHATNSSCETPSGCASEGKQGLRQRKCRKVLSSPVGLKPGIDYTITDCQGRWGYMVSEGSHIFRGYRLGLSFWQCIRSMFQLHNETINVWSHLLGSILFVCLLFYVKDMPAFERPKRMVRSVVQSMPIGGSNASAFCSANCSNQTNFTGLSPEKYAFSMAQRHFAAAKDILKHAEFKLPGLERWREIVQANTKEMGRNMAEEAHAAQLLVQEKLENAMHNLDKSLETIRHELSQLGSVSMEGCVMCWADLVRRLASVKQKLQDQVSSITTSMGHIDDHNSLVWGLSPSEWAEYTASEVSSVTTALNNGISAAKRALIHASVNIQGEMVHEMQKVREVINQDFFHRFKINGETLNSQAIVERWPIVIFLLSAFTCLLTSASYHLFNCHSLTLANVLLFLDYAGISILIGGSFVPPIFYGFYCDVSLRNMYLAIIAVFSISSAGIGIYSGLKPSPSSCLMRVLVYSGNALFAVVPCGHLLLRYLHGEPCWTPGLVYISAMIGIYALGSVIYYYRFPERYWPGKFDIVFSSHQLWHIVSSASSDAAGSD
ncbi:hypothetical protein GUITHDRAFT_121917 [Guillardia theta CCMP2712]|uniref:Uncharacterized protein n=1 Tax=Guillardia theta (strain CCMP2712) TaxID=905079 RepID=L1I6L2_GUITC|nr:hypothetical protein GUITHDRAFT_121917 [Guillardia theta CCMP2712]EKX31893.1 hypothetical protein GUITHDRAFT_121917 [Guillardia theta CCMP2712]|eukprot:XP_005818873.1 hypothetical protein GUITHDRAFT_121917 [Guillardia theta CCMP2712]